MPSSRGSSQPRDQAHISYVFCTGRWIIYQEKAMAPHSSTLAWKIPWMEEPGRLQSMGSLRIGHDWATSLSLFTFMHWRRKWQPTPVFLPGDIQGLAEPGGLPSMRSHRVGHDWNDLAAAPSGKPVGNIVGYNSLGILEKSKKLCYLEEFTAPAAVGHLRDYRTHEKR